MDLDAPFERVLAAARAGEGWALAELFRDLHPRIRRYLKSLAPTVADDIASDTWLDIVRSLDRFRGDASDLRALAFSYARTHLAEARDSMPLVGDDVIAALEAAPRVDVPRPSPASDADPVLATLDTDAALERIMTLPIEHAEVILLRVLGGLSIDEVAATVGKPSRAVRSIERDALQHLAIVTAEERTSR
jgi:RNA polymerase sigma-70 factor (ECF subfamily)